MAQTPRPADAVRIGQVFLGKYRVESIIGQGGMGVVAECTHLQLNQRLAIKMLRQDVLADADAVERFMREAQAASKLRSEYVAHVSDVGRLENGTPYMVMEFLEGMDLGALITDRGKLAIPWACDLMMQTAEALAEAHSLGIVHRNLRPANIRLGAGDSVKLIDFGLAKLRADAPDEELTVAGQAVGTLQFMAPEQLAGHTCDARADLYALGGIAVELLTGRARIPGSAPALLPADVPSDVQRILQRCLAQAPGDRYQSALELGLVLDRVLAPRALPVAHPVTVPAPARRERVLAHTPAFELEPPRIMFEDELPEDDDDLDIPPRRRIKAWAVAAIMCGVALGTAVAGCV